MDRNTGGNNLVNKLMQAIFSLTATTTYTPGAGGGSAFTVTVPFHLRLMSAVGSDTANGTEMTTGNLPGYTVGGLTMGSAAFGAPSAGVITNSNAISYSITGAQTANVTSCEIWDTAATALRYLQGNLTAAISGAANGDTINFAVSSISYDGSGF
jgi:hypothetical protein